MNYDYLKKHLLPPIIASNVVCLKYQCVFNMLFHFNYRAGEWLQLGKKRHRKLSFKYTTVCLQEHQIHAFSPLDANFLLLQWLVWLWHQSLWDYCVLSLIYFIKDIGFTGRYDKHSKSESCNMVTWFLKSKDLSFPVMHSDCC